ncbi:nucleoside-diphosphate sugar epimerase/dehydratase [Lysinibacillus fusiformis]|uniref:nucleoside-diphosphate sugar epimerase/dehydratase n=1 Tax=Lysinibacillus fusiformis TaxID=28031 RepID=UPI003555D5D2
MLEAIIWGIGQASVMIESILDKEEVNIIGYVDNDPKKWGHYKNGLLIYDPSKLNKLTYDIILIASSFHQQIMQQIKHLEISNQKVINVQKMVEDSLEQQSQLASYKYYLNKLKRDLDLGINATDLDTLITGLSYAECGIISENISKKTLNLANAGQDLFYDYLLLKTILEQSDNHIQNVVIGLSYYSFEYDLSLSKVHGLRCKYIYEPVLKESHNLYSVLSEVESEKIYEGKKKFFQKFESKIFKSEESLTEIIKNNNLSFKVPTYERFDRYTLEEKNKNGKFLAELDSKKNYPLTVKENREIFSDLLKLLEEKQVNILLVIFPVSKYYKLFFDDKLKEQFYYILNNFLNDYRVTLIDLYNTELFEDMHFSNSSHLNYYGAVKVTDIINSFLK